MKKITLMAVMMTIVLSAAAMPFSEARSKALFLSDKMAYELNLTESQLEAVYEINLDYMLNIDDATDMFGYLWEIRNRDLGEVLADWQYGQYLTCTWFYKPFTFNDEGWSLAIYNRYKGGLLFMNQSDLYLTYHGGHNQMETSFYAGQDFDQPETPMYLGQAK